MDVRSLLVVLLMLSACNQKTTKTVFPENSKKTTGQCAQSLIRNQFIVNWENGEMSFEKSENADLFEQGFVSENLDKIKHVEFDKTIQLNSIPQLETSYGSPYWGQERIEADVLWSGGVLGQGVTVAVLDAAVDYTHSQIRPRLHQNDAEINGRDGFDDDHDGFIDNYHGWDFYRNQPAPIVNSEITHGTHVAGIVLADHSSGLAKGIAPQSTLIPINFMSTNGNGPMSAAISGIKYASDHGAKIINASWGGECADSDSLKTVIQDLQRKNVLFVSAAGNSGVDIGANPTFPASYNLSNQITVAAIRPTDIIASFSNTSLQLVHLAAPGENILSSVPGGYDSYAGTSMAAPFVSGASALLWSDRPQATVLQIKQALLAGVDSGPHRVLTRGRLNVKKALDELRRLVP